MTLISALKNHELILVFYYAKGYSSFDYCSKEKHWKIEKFLSGSSFSQLVILNDDIQNHGIFSHSLDESHILREMREENICLRFDKDRNFELYFAALPEIVASDSLLANAFMKVIAQKELGNILTQDVIDAVNLNRSKIVRGQ